MILDKLKAAGVETKLVVKKGQATAGPILTRTCRSSPTGSTGISRRERQDLDVPRSDRTG